MVSVHDLANRLEAEYALADLNHYDRARPWYVTTLFYPKHALTNRLTGSARASASRNATQSSSTCLVLKPLFFRPPH